MLSASEYETIAVELTDGVATLTLNRPEHGNSVDDRMHSELATIFTAVRRTREIRAVVLTGAGDTFCSGGDSSPTRTFETFTGLTPIDEARTIIETLIDLDQPLVAAVNGDARGLGAILATFADAAFIARSAKIGDAHVRGGVTAGNGSAALWPLLIGLNASKELLLGGRIIDAEEAVRLGLVREAVDEAEVLPRAHALAGRMGLAAGPRPADDQARAQRPSQDGRGPGAAVRARARRADPRAADGGSPPRIASRGILDHAEQVANLENRARPRSDLAHDPGHRRRHDHGGLLGLDLDEVRARLDRLAVGHEPLHDLGLAHAHAELRQAHFGSQLDPSADVEARTRATAASTLSFEG